MSTALRVPGNQTPVGVAPTRHTTGRMETHRRMQRRGEPSSGPVLRVIE